MQNSNPVTNFISISMNGFKYLIFLFLTIFVLCESSYCQTELPLPTEFQNISINARALSKEFEFTLDSNTASTNQNFSLDKTGHILHLVPFPKIDDENTKIKIFASDGSKVQTYRFIDDTIFALVDPQRTYSIYEEIIPKRDDLIMSFEFDQASTICPYTELFKLYENIMIDKDTSFKINLRKPDYVYSITASISPNTQFLMAENFRNINISLGTTSQTVSKREQINIADMLPLGSLCFVSKKKKPGIKEITSCSLINDNVNSVITFKNSLAAVPPKSVITVSAIPPNTNTFALKIAFDNDILKLNEAFTDNGMIVFSDTGLVEIFSDMSLPKTIELTVGLSGIALGMSSFLVENILDMANNGTVITQAIATTDVDSISVIPDSTSTYFTDKDVSTGMLNILFSLIPGRLNSLFTSYVFEFSEDIKSKNQSTEINNSSQDKYFFESYGSSFSVNLGPILAVVKKVKKNVISLTNPIKLNKTLNDNYFSIPLNKTEAILSLPLSTMSFDSFLSNISLSTNEDSLNVYNLFVENNIVIKNLLDLEHDNQKLRTVVPDSLIISSYLPDKLSNLTINRNYTFVEQITATNVDDTGDSIEITNNKSRADLILSKSFSNIDSLNQTNPFLLSIEKPSVLLNNKSFNKQGNLTGFLIPPDFRPILENGYRATIGFTMTINLADNEILKIMYADLKTKDETPLSDFFSFSFLPFGKYDVNLEFDSNRTKLFQNAGTIKSNK